ncbi:sensor histidine kinase [Chitinophaga skermanii]|nr:HAMP domain-containing sensor histidine kinase [Chitinophaga skermanii]
MFTFAFGFNNYWAYYSSPQGVQKSIEKSIHASEREFERLSTDTLLMQQLLNRRYSSSELSWLYRQDLNLYTYDISSEGQWLTFWSTNSVLPEGWADRPKEGISFQHLRNGYYVELAKKIGEKDGHEQYLVGLIPVRLEYAINNNYLVNQFYNKSAIGQEYTIHTRPPGLPILSETNTQILFYLYYDAGSFIRPPSLASVLLITFGCICILIFINLFATLLAKKANPLWGFLLLLVVVIGFRVLTYVYPFPFDLTTLNLFSPTIYAKDDVFRSLGDLMLNVLLVFWLILFFRQHVRTIKPPVVKKKWQLWLIIVLAGFVMYVVGQFLSDLMQSLVIDSRISFDVTDFFSLTEYSVIGTIVLGFVAINFLFFSQIINYFLNQLTNFQLRSKYLFLAITGLLWLLLRIKNPEIGYSVALMIWVLGYVVLLDLLAQKFEGSPASVPFLFWMLVMTITTSAVLIYYNGKKELSVRMRMAENISKQKDPYLETLMADVGERLDTDEFVTSFFLNKSKRYRDELKNELKTKYFNGYLNKFNTTIYTYDEHQQPLYNDDSLTYDTFQRVIFPESELPSTVSAKGLYYYERSFADYSYIAERRIINREDSTTLGYVIYMLTPEVAQKEKLYPELLIEGDNLDQNRDPNSSYSYAVYDKGVLVNNYNDYPFAVKLYASDIPTSDYQLKSENGYSLLFYKASKDKVAVIVKKNRAFAEFITLFAYMFCLFLIIIAIYSIFDILIKARMRVGNLRQMLNFNIRRKVQGTIIFIVVFAFLVVGVTTILFYIDRYKTDNREKLSSTMHEIATDIEGIFSTQKMFDAMEGIYDPVFQPELFKAITKIADEHSVDINIYDTDGQQQLGTQPLIAQKGLQSTKMDPMAFYELSGLNRIQFIQSESIGKLQFISGYVPLRENGNVFAYINVPYFATQTELKQQISTFLVTLIIINAFIFLIAGFVAIAITNSITKSFSLVAARLRSVNLDQRNDEIEWNKNDEIGVLVKEYNKMVQQLEVSAMRLAKSEREGAWREMARQVAHEIKNPLTPMKLSIQYLQRAIANDSPDVKALSKKVANTLVEQIEHLSNIASDFSAFARISEANNEIVLLNEMLRSLTSLYASSPECEVIYMEPTQSFYVWADKTQMNRLFTNLLLNAIQAMPEEQIGEVRIQMQSSEENKFVLVSVKDNGSGIPDEVRPKIFVPNFTTKSSGTGLGLAMCKNIVEQARGEIWFETQAGVGTTFFVRLPLVEGVAE